jgi:hypothetical protein
MTVVDEAPIRADERSKVFAQIQDPEWRKAHCLNGHEKNEKTHYVRADGSFICRLCRNASIRRHNERMKATDSKLKKAGKR